SDVVAASECPTTWPTRAGGRSVDSPALSWGERVPGDSAPLRGPRLAPPSRRPSSVGTSHESSTGKSAWHSSWVADGLRFEYEHSAECAAQRPCGLPPPCAEKGCHRLALAASSAFSLDIESGRVRKHLSQ